MQFVPDVIVDLEFLCETTEKFEENQYDYDIYQKIWTDDAAALLRKEGDAAFAENEEMFRTASVFVHSNDELKEAFKKAQIA